MPTLSENLRDLSTSLKIIKDTEYIDPIKIIKYLDDILIFLKKSTAEKNELEILKKDMLLLTALLDQEINASSSNIWVRITLDSTKESCLTVIKSIEKMIASLCETHSNDSPPNNFEEFLSLPEETLSDFRKVLQEIEQPYNSTNFAQNHPSIFFNTPQPQPTSPSDSNNDNIYIFLSILKALQELINKRPREQNVPPNFLGNFHPK